MDGNLRFGEFVPALLCFNVRFLTDFGHGGNSHWKIEIRCDASTRDTLDWASSLLDERELARQK
jgi:hypothetical protein